VELDDIEIARLVHFDPRLRCVLCATGLIDSTETLLGIGAIRLGSSDGHELLIVDDGSPEGLAENLSRALLSTATRPRRSRAA
jgi:hypothetical protein